MSTAGWRTKARPWLIPAIVALDAIACVAIVIKVSYTEIDWIAYMQEVEGFLGGEMDYLNLRGDTGPLVYPAGFVYLFSALYYVTNLGKNIALAQWIWVALYLAVTTTVMKLYYKAGAPTLLVVVLVLSKRIHSIFMLRMFNDCVAIALAYLAFAAIVMGAKPRWILSSILYSLGVSVKMNLFLFAPGLLTVWLRCLGFAGAVKQITVCALVQLVLGAPFLMTFPKSYITKAFELSRAFDFTWTVNFRFLGPDVFASPMTGLVLLGLTLAAWLAVWRCRWAKRDLAAGGAAVVLATLFESNLIGIAFSRTLHYQFYSWFFHQLPFVLWFSCDALPALVRVAIIAGVEVAFNVYPSTNWSSALLIVVLWTTVAAIVLGHDVKKRAATASAKKLKR